MKDLILTVPEDVLQAAKVPPSEREGEFLKELAVALYARNILSLGKARSLAKMTRWEFEELLGQRQIVRHYDEASLEEDLQYGLGYK
ncbi:UPF0175 family protein [candidate division KSB1 bacterium]|nr:MAG: UPF0175 family protein [candidate division KSB1 bacterium]